MINTLMREPILLPFPCFITEIIEEKKKKYQEAHDPTRVIHLVFFLFLFPICLQVSGDRPIFAPSIVTFPFFFFFFFPEAKSPPRKKNTETKTQTKKKKKNLTEKKKILVTSQFGVDKWKFLSGLWSSACILRYQWLPRVSLHDDALDVLSPKNIFSCTQCVRGGRSNSSPAHECHD